MPAKVNKTIVTNVAALKAKYGTEGWNRIKDAISGLIAADAKRGLNTLLVAIDNAATMRKLKGKAVARAGEPKQNKAAIDAVYKALVPEYVMILGAVDVVPHQDMVNPAAGDGDPIAYGDLPYACEKRYSRKIEDFTAVTRVVGRLPDVTGGSDPAHLVKLLEVAAQYSPRPPGDYQPYLGMTAAVWADSTALSLKAAFGNADMLQQIPPKGTPWPAASLEARAHFINCHGAPADTRYYGQSGNTYPVAHDATLLTSGVADGTVAAAECCYGAELFDPKLAGGNLGMVNTYLAGKAYGFFGSSTIAYGPADTNGQADLICQYFMKHVMAGASLGRAALLARQEFVASASVVDPTDLKTLAQFSLMGDPSLQPVQAPRGMTVLKAGKGVAEIAANALHRELRRNQLAARGLSVGANATVVDSTTRRAATPSVKALLQSELHAAAEQLQLPADAPAEASFSTFSVRGPRAIGKALRAQPPATVHLAILKASEPQAGPRQIVAVVAIERGGVITARRLFAR